MYGTGEDTAKDNPQITGRAELGTHDGSENGARSCDVQELDHEHPPGGHLDKVHAVGLGDGGREARGIRTEHPVHKGSVKDIAQDQGNDA